MANFAQDDFSTETDGQSLAGNTDNLGNTWHGGSGSSVALVVAVTGFTPHVLQNSSSYTNPYFYDDGTPPSADYTVQCDVLCNGSTASTAGVTGRMSSGAQTYYVAYGQNNVSQWRLDKVVAGVNTNLGTSAQTFVNGTTYSTLQLIMSGTTISLAQNGSTLITVTDSAIAAAGFAGVNVNGNATQSVMLLKSFSAFPNAAAAHGIKRNALADGLSAAGPFFAPMLARARSELSQLIPRPSLIQIRPTL